MSEITFNDLIENENINQIGFKVQEQINRVRRRIANDALSIWSSTQIEHDDEVIGYMDVSSGASTSISRYVASLTDKASIEEFNKSYDSRSWVEPKQTYSYDLISSIPSMKKFSVYEWVSFIRSNLLFLDMHDQLADRIMQLLSLEII